MQLRSCGENRCLAGDEHSTHNRHRIKADTDMSQKQTYVDHKRRNGINRSASQLSCQLAITDDENWETAGWQELRLGWLRR